MSDSKAFSEQINAGYSFKGETLRLGRAMFNNELVDGADIFIPLKTMNRHGLIAGATGTGKTKTLQVMAEALSDASVSVLVMDIKGDLSGIAESGVSNDKIKERSASLGIDYKPTAYPVELLTLSNEKGVRLRATVSEFGPVLLSKILGLNDTQEGLVAMIFKFCDDAHYPLLDIKDLKKVLQYISAEGKGELEKDYGKISTASAGTILRKVIELEQQGADLFFGEKSFEVDDLMRISDDGRGIISVLRVADLQDRPKLFSTFMLQMLAELYATLPEEGDLDKPKLVMFIDEAHLVFQEASSELLKQIETIVKLIRSKGVGVFFCTQNPMDVPPSVLAQLGLKVQHALRAFTANDRKDIKQTAANYPESSFYKTEDIITQLGIGEALITCLNEKGVPTPLVQVRLAAPRSRMDILTADEINTLVSNSHLVKKYEETIDRDSAYEMLTRKLQEAADNNTTQNTTKGGPKQEPSMLEKFLDNSAVRQAGRTAASIITRSLLGALGLGGKSKR